MSIAPSLLLPESLRRDLPSMDLMTLMYLTFSPDLAKQTSHFLHSESLLRFVVSLHRIIRGTILLLVSPFPQFELLCIMSHNEDHT